MLVLCLFLLALLYCKKATQIPRFSNGENCGSPSNEDHNIKTGMVVLILVIVGAIVVVVTLCLRVTPEDAYKLLRIIIDWLLDQDWLFDYNALSFAAQKLYHILS